MSLSATLALFAVSLLGVLGCGARTTTSGSDGRTGGLDAGDGAAGDAAAGDAAASLPDACAPSASTADLVCASVLTYYWDGARCKPLVECYCNNVGCVCRDAGCIVFGTLAECAAAYAACP
jgi:hypothetical protein